MKKAQRVCSWHSWRRPRARQPSRQPSAVAAAAPCKFYTPATRSPAAACGAWQAAQDGGMGQGEGCSVPREWRAQQRLQGTCPGLSETPAAAEPGQSTGPGGEEPPPPPPLWQRCAGAARGPSQPRLQGMALHSSHPRSAVAARQPAGAPISARQNIHGIGALSAQQRPPTLRTHKASLQLASPSMVPLAPLRGLKQGRRGELSRRRRGPRNQHSSCADEEKAGVPLGRPFRSPMRRAAPARRQEGDYRRRVARA